MVEVVDEENKDETDDDVVVAIEKIRKGAGTVKPAKSRIGKPKKAARKKIIVVKRNKANVLEGPDPNVDSIFPTQDDTPSKGPYTSSKQRKVQKKEKVLTREERIKVLRTRKVLNGWVCDLKIFDKLGMRELVEIVTFQEWIHLFELPVHVVHDKEV